MSLESATYISDLVVTNPTSSDPKSQGDDHLRLLKSTIKATFPSITGIVTKSHTELNTVTDRGLIAGQTWTGTHTFPATTYGVTAAFGASGTAYATLDFVNAVATSAVLPGQTGNDGKILITNGTTASWTDDFQLAMNEKKGTDIASAATINLTTATGNYVHVTGTTTITGITIPVGAERDVIFDGILDLTHSAALLCPGGVTIKTAANDRAKVRGDTAGAIITHFTRASGIALAAFPYLNVRDEKADGTAGGSSLATDITQTRVLNTTKTNTMGAVIASNTITLLAGTYQIRARAPGCGVTFHKALLYNVTDGTYPIVGSSAKESVKTSNADSLISGQFTITSTKNFTIRHYTTSAVATDGLGQPATIGQVEVYTEVEMWKVA
jgi:hypothetical protein